MSVRITPLLVAMALMGISFLAPTASPVEAAHRHGSTEPVPIPGGDIIPDFGIIHQYVPGPIGVHPLFEGEDVEPNGITNFRGFIGMAFFVGTARDTTGAEYHLESDIRVYQGEYLSLDGTHHRGTFVEI